MVIDTPAIANQAICNRVIVGRMVGTNMIADKDANKIIEPSKIYSFSWSNRHVTLVGRCTSESDLDTLESNTRKALGGSKTLLIPGQPEEEVDITANQENSIWLGFDYDNRQASNMKDGFYLLKGMEMINPPGKTTLYMFSLNLFRIGDSL